jgi:hypothetical protein
MDLSTKGKGGLGVCKVIQFFIERSIPVFVEALCDCSEIDLIVQYNGLRSIQVRCTTTTSDVAYLSLRKTTPGTRQTFCKTRRFSDLVDVFALYVRDRDLILWISREDATNRKRSVGFRFGPAKNGQRIGCRYADAYMLPPFMRNQQLIAGSSPAGRIV